MSEGSVGGDSGGAGEGAAGGAAGSVAPPPASGAPGGEGAATPGGTPTPEPPPAPAWVEGFDADELAYVANKGWNQEGKGPRDVLTSYRNLERLRGVSADRLAKIPDWNNSEERTEFNERLGVPKSAESYEKPDITLTNGVPVDGEVVQNLSHRLGLRPDQHAEAATFVQELFEGSIAEKAEARELDEAAGKVELSKLWKDEEATNHLAASRAMDRFGVDDAMRSAIQSEIGYQATMELFARVGRGLGEHQRGDESNPNPPSAFQMTSEVAKAQLKQLNSDKDHFAKLEAGDAVEIAKRENLMRIAFGGS